MKNNPKQKYHFFAVSGLCIWRSADDTEVHQVHANAMIQMDSRKVTQYGIGMAQQGLMKSVMSKMPDGAVTPDKFVDVLIIGLSWCGEMTEAEFYAVPEGQIRQQLAQAQAEAKAEEEAKAAAASQPLPEKQASENADRAAAALEAAESQNERA